MIPIIFIHIPKTAGVSISRLPIECDIHNYPENMLKKVGADYWNKAFKFTVIRHPCDRFVSAYYYLKNTFVSTFCREICAKENNTNPVGTLPNDDFWGFDVREATYCQTFSSLEDFVLNGKPKHWLHFIPQINWLRLPLERIMRYETVNEEIKEMFGIKLPRLNRTTHPPWEELFTPQMMQKIQEIYKEDFEFEKNMPNSMWTTS